MVRAAVIFHHIGPYHHARLNAASSTCNLVAIEWSAEGSYEWGDCSYNRNYDIVTLFQKARRGLHCGNELHARLCSALVKIKPDVVFVNGWGDFGAMQAIAALEKCRIPAVIMSDSNAFDFPRHLVTEHIKRRLVSFFQAGLSSGTLAQSYLVSLGLSKERVFKGYDVVDNSYFTAGAEVARAAGDVPDAIDSEWCGRFFFASARFVEKKNLRRLLDAFASYRYAAGSSSWPLVLLGDGAMRGELERQSAALKLEGALVMPGFRQYDELPRYYGNAGVFVHASTTEQWGLVVNEAMASGLPVLVSRRCGCACDLVDEGRNGFTFDPYNVEELARLMFRVASKSCDRVAMGQASRQIIGNWSPNAFAKGLTQAAEVALRRGPGVLGLVDKALVWALSCRR